MPNFGLRKLALAAFVALALAGGGYAGGRFHENRLAKAKYLPVIARTAEKYGKAVENLEEVGKELERQGVKYNDLLADLEGAVEGLEASKKIASSLLAENESIRAFIEREARKNAGLRARWRKLRLRPRVPPERLVE